jgi:hypothetical protein
MPGLHARLDILPDAQRTLWTSLRPALELGFVLYGGTALALRLGHRTSIDFDFFSEKELDASAIAQHFALAERSTVLQDRGNSLTWLVGSTTNPNQQVKISFFGAVDFGRVDVPQITADRVMQVASLKDLMATKLKVILQRAEAKDYVVIAAMLQANVNLAHGLAAARAMFGHAFQPAESLRALTFFKDGDLPSLSEEIKRVLVSSAQTVRDLPTVEVVASRLAI